MKPSYTDATYTGHVYTYTRVSNVTSRTCDTAFPLEPLFFQLPRYTYFRVLPLQYIIPKIRPFLLPVSFSYYNVIPVKDWD